MRVAAGATLGLRACQHESRRPRRTALAPFLDEVRIEMDNNAAERGAYGVRRAGQKHGNAVRNVLAPQLRGSRVEADKGSCRAKV
jgi:hypothetical protein